MLPISPPTARTVDTRSADPEPTPSIVTRPTKPRPFPSVVRPTETDAQLVGLLCKYRMATVPLLHQYVFPGVSAQMVYKRLGRLMRAGLVEKHTNGLPRDMHAIYVASRRGYEWVGSELDSRFVLSLATLHHTLAVAQVGLSYEQKCGVTVHSDREIRSALAREKSDRAAGRLTPQPLIARADDHPVRPRLWLNMIGGGQHSPDLVLIGKPRGADRSITRAVEVELTSKTPTRVQEILRSYKRDDAFDDVLYITSDQSVARLIRREADILGLGRSLRLRGGFEPSHSVSTRRR